MMSRRALAMPAGYDNRRPLVSKKELPARHAMRLEGFIRRGKVAMAQRANANIEQVGLKVYRGDMHMHTYYSDGAATVEDNKRMADLTGLHFIFITDHRTVHQRKECSKFSRCWVGQEPGSRDHHLGLLGLRDTFVPDGDIVADYQRAVQLGIFPFIPHPCGWYPQKHYTRRQIDMVGTIGDDLTIELINGAAQTTDAWDVTDARTVKLWDRLLSQGKTVRIVGNSDAHVPEGVGCVWNAVVAQRCTEKTILAALWKGHNYISEAPALKFRCGGKIMGDRVKPHGATLRFTIAAADVFGLREVRLVTRGGRVAKRWRFDEQTTFKTAHEQRLTAQSRYFRLEVEAFDGKKAFSNPIYLA